MSKNTRPTGALATRLNPGALLEAARDQLPGQYPGWDPALLSSGPLPQMLLIVDRDLAAIVNGAGVGAVADVHNIIDIWFFYDDELIMVALHLATIANAFTLDEIDIADGIRTCGDQLDANHREWYDRFHCL